MTYNKVIYIVRVCFVDILIPHFLMGGLVNTPFFKVGRLQVHFGASETCVRDDCWILCIRESIRCLGHNLCLTAIDVGRPKLPLHILNLPGKLVQGFRHKIEDLTFQVTPLTLEVGLVFGLWTLVFVPSLLASVLLVLGYLPLVVGSQVLQIISFGYKGMV